MLKKSLIFGSAALVLLALALTGCSQATGSDKTEIRAENYIYGREVTAGESQKVIDRAIATGRPVVLAGANFTGSGVIDFKGVRIQVEGTVTIEGADLYLNAAKSVITYDTGAGIKVNNGY
jgi:hypothetical protein